MLFVGAVHDGTASGNLSSPSVGPGLLSLSPSGFLPDHLLLLSFFYILLPFITSSSSSPSSTSNQHKYHDELAGAKPLESSRVESTWLPTSLQIQKLYGTVIHCLRLSLSCIILLSLPPLHILLCLSKGGHSSQWQDRLRRDIVQHNDHDELEAGAPPSKSSRVDSSMWPRWLQLRQHYVTVTHGLLGGESDE
jgi:hypothetical protein